ncbi:hypothetical protein MN116_006922, partial [Schistosoma mekongi]
MILLFLMYCANALYCSCNYDQYILHISSLPGYSSILANTRNVFYYVVFNYDEKTNQ